MGKVLSKNKKKSLTSTSVQQQQDDAEGASGAPPPQSDESGGESKAGGAHDEDEHQHNKNYDEKLALAPPTMAERAVFENKLGDEIATMTWKPEAGKECIGHVLLVHGAYEHIARYEEVALAFTKLGFAVHGNDHIGHGLSGGTKGMFDKYEHLVDDAITVIEKGMETEKPGLPVFLLGHSFGGALAIHIALKRPTLFRGVVLSAPLVYLPADVSDFMKELNHIASHLVPELRTRPIAWQKTSHNSEDYKNDPLIDHRGLRVNVVEEMNQCSEGIKKQIQEFDFKVLYLQGTEDVLVDRRGADFFMDNISSIDKKILFYDGLYHELFKENDKERIINDVTSWVMDHM